MATLTLRNSRKLDGDPYMTHRFVVEIGGSVVASFSQFSGIKEQVQTVQARAGDDIRGVQEYIPVLTSFAPVTLTRGVVHGKNFLTWLESCAASRFLGPSGKTLQRTIDITALDDDGNRGICWTLYKAMPVAYELAPMDAARDEVLCESVTFAFLALQRQALPTIHLPDAFTPKKTAHKRVTKPKNPKPVPLNTHKKVTKVAKVVLKGTHKKVPPATQTTTETAAPATPKPTHKKVTRVIKTVPKNTHKKVTRPPKATVTPVMPTVSPALQAALKKMAAQAKKALEKQRAMQAFNRFRHKK